MKEFVGKWKIIEMEQWDQEYIDLIEPGYIQFDSEQLGEIRFGTVHGFLDCRFSSKGQPPKVNFSWDGGSEGDPVSGRGWVELTGKNKIYGMLYIHRGDESWFNATKE